MAARGQDNPSKMLSFHKNSNVIHLVFVNNDDSVLSIAFALGVVPIPV